MSMTSRQTTMLIAGIGVAVLAGVLLTLGLGWRVNAGDGEPAGGTDGTSAMDDKDSYVWALPAFQSRDRTTRPLLELVGVHIEARDAKAMIREKDGATQIYRVGDQVVDNRVLVEIHETHVLMRNEGRIERLRITGRSARQRPDPGELEEFAEQLTTRPDDSDRVPPD